MAWAADLVDGGARVGAAFLDLLMPPTCTGCGKPVAAPHGLCAECWTAMPANQAARCVRCAVPLPIEWAVEQDCFGCAAEPPAFAAAEAPFLYAGVARSSVLALKGGREALARPMAAAMRRQGAALIAAADAIVPVPLHRWRLARRGFNQAVLLARALGPEGPPMRLDLLVRAKATPISHGLSRRGRRRNVEGAFRCPPAAPAAIKGQTILLVDDVITTGATADAAARSLKRAGAARVLLLAYARVAATDTASYVGSVATMDA